MIFLVGMVVFWLGLIWLKLCAIKDTSQEILEELKYIRKEMKR